MNSIETPEISNLPSGGKRYRWQPGDATLYSAILNEISPEGIEIGGFLGGISGPGHIVSWALSGQTMLLPVGPYRASWVFDDLKISNKCSQFQCLLFLQLYARSDFGLELTKRGYELYTNGRYPLEALGPIATGIDKGKVST